MLLGVVGGVGFVAPVSLLVFVGFGKVGRDYWVSWAGWDVGGVLGCLDVLGRVRTC